MRALSHDSAEAYSSTRSLPAPARLPRPPRDRSCTAAQSPPDASSDGTQAGRRVRVSVTPSWLPGHRCAENWPSGHAWAGKRAVRRRPPPRRVTFRVAQNPKPHRALKSGPAGVPGAAVRRAQRGPGCPADPPSSPGSAPTAATAAPSAAAGQARREGGGTAGGARHARVGSPGSEARDIRCKVRPAANQRDRADRASPRAASVGNSLSGSRGAKPAQGPVPTAPPAACLHWTIACVHLSSQLACNSSTSTRLYCASISSPTSSDSGQPGSTLSRSRASAWTRCGMACCACCASFDGERMSAAARRATPPPAAPAAPAASASCNAAFSSNSDTRSRPPVAVLRRDHQSGTAAFVLVSNRPCPACRAACPQEQALPRHRRGLAPALRRRLATAAAPAGSSAAGAPDAAQQEGDKRLEQRGTQQVDLTHCRNLRVGAEHMRPRCDKWRLGCS